MGVSAGKHDICVHLSMHISSVHLWVWVCMCVYTHSLVCIHMSKINLSKFSLPDLTSNYTPVFVDILDK